MNQAPASTAAKPRLRDQKYCYACGELIKSDAAACPKCGEGQHGTVSKTALLLLTFFLGGFGAHKFYLRKHWQGVLYLVFFWTMIPGLVSLVEFFVYAFTPSEKLRGQYHSSTSGVVVAIIAVLAAVFLTGILAAIAIPAYQDYTIRARVIEALHAAKPVQQSVFEYISKNGALPNSAAEVGLSGDRATEIVQSIDVGSAGSVVITFGPKYGAVNGQTIVLVPEIRDNRLYWHCTYGTLPARYRPPECRSLDGSRNESRT